MNKIFVVCLLLQAVYATRNISIVIDGPRESPAGVTYVDGKAPEDLKAGPVKNSTQPKERITHAAFIRGSNRAIPKDDEIENEEFERFIQKHHNRPTIETVFVSSSPSPLTEDYSEEYNEESSSLKSQAELFKRPEQSQTFERFVALPSVPPSIHPPSDHGSFTILDQHAPIGQSGGVSFSGGEGIIVPGDGGQYSAFINGQYLPSLQGQFGGGEQQLYQVSQAIPTVFTRTINVPQQAVKTKTYEIRRPAIQKHYYDIEERVIIRPAGSIVVELDRPVAKIPTGETIVALGGTQGRFGGAGIQQQQGAIGVSQGGFDGLGIQQQQGVIGVSQGDLQGSLFGLGVQESQGGLDGLNIQQQGAIGASQGGFGGVGIQQQGGGGAGIQQQQGTNGISQEGFGVGIQQQQGLGGGDGIQQQQGAVGASLGGQGEVGIQQQQGGVGGIQQQQGAAGTSQGGFGVGIQQQQGAGGGVGIQQQQGAVGAPQGTQGGVGVQQQQGGVGGVQQKQGVGGTSQGGFSASGISYSTTLAPSTPSISFGGLGGAGIQQQQGAAGTSPGGFGGVGIQQQQGGVGGVQQQQGSVGISQGRFGGSGISYSTTLAPSIPSFSFGASQGSQGGVGIQQQQGGGIQQQQGVVGTSQGGLSGSGISYSTTLAPSTPSFNFGVSQDGLGGVGIQQQQGAVGTSQGGFGGVGIQQQQGGSGGVQQQQGGIGISQGRFGGSGISYSTTLVPSTPSLNFGVSQGELGGVNIQQGSQGGFGGVGIQQQQGEAGGIQQQQGGIGISQRGFGGSGISYSTTLAPSTPSFIFGVSQGQPGGNGIQQQQGAIGTSQGGLGGVGIQQQQGGVGGIQQQQGAVGLSQGGLGGISYSTTLAPSTPSFNFGVSQGGLGIQQQQGGIGGAQQSQGGISYSTTFAPSTPTVNIGFPQQTQSGISYSTTFSPSTSSISIGGQQGGFGSLGGGLGGAGFQQSQGGYTYSSTPIPFITPTSPAPRISIGGIQQQQGAIGVSQGGLTTGVGFQQSQGGIISSTTPSPFIPPIIPRPSYSQDSSVVVAAKSNVQNQGTFSSSTTTERSFTSTLSQDASAFAKASSTGSVQAITSNGSPLGQYQQQPFARVQSYPRMRYQGQLLTGEVKTDDGQQSPQQDGYGALSKKFGEQKTYESPAYVAEIPQNTQYEEQPAEIQENTQYQHRQLVGSNREPVQASPISSSAHQQPAQVHQHYFVTSTSQPVKLIHHRQFVAEVTQQPIVASSYQPAKVQEVPQQQLQPKVYAPKPNLVAQIRRQQAAQTAQDNQHASRKSQQPHQQYIAHVSQQQVPNEAQTYQQHAAEIIEEPTEIRSKTSRQYPQQQSDPSFQYNQEVVSTTHHPESYNSGQRLYKQRGLPAKYTQHHTINVAPSHHTIFFSSQPQQVEGSERSQNLETPPEPEGSAEETTAHSTTIMPTTTAAAISSTTPEENVSQKQTYASILASKPGILYATSPVPRHHINHAPFLRFSSQGSSLFAPNGRQVHFVYSQPSEAYSQHIAPKSAQGHHLELINDDPQAQVPGSHQKQIELSATAPVNEPQQSRSQSRNEFQQNARISSTTPASANVHNQERGHQKYRNEQTHGAITLRSGRTYGDHRVIASTPAPSDGGAASESVQTRRIVVNHPFQTVQEIVEREPITKFHQITVNEPPQVRQHHDALHAAQSREITAKQEPNTNVQQVTVNEQTQQYRDGPQQDQQKAAYRHPTAAAYKVAATFNHPATSLSFHHGGLH